MTGSGAPNDLTSYLLGERSELRPLLETIAQTEEADAQSRAAVEYLLVLASARYAATGRPPEDSALLQIRNQYSRTFSRDASEHARLLVEIRDSLSRSSATAVTTALKLLGPIIADRASTAWRVPRSRWRRSWRSARRTRSSS